MNIYPDSTYSAALKSFEEEIGRKVTDNFSRHDCGGLVLLKLFRTWEEIFRNRTQKSTCLSLSVQHPSDYLMKRSLLYSPNIVAPLPDRVIDEWWAPSVVIPESYFDFLRKYHRLIRNDLACVVMGEFEFIGSAIHDEPEVSNFSELRLPYATVSDAIVGLNDAANDDRLHFRLMLPDVSRVDLSDLLILSQDEEIFHNYHAVLSLLNLRNIDMSPEERLRHLVLEVDDRTRDLNARFKQLAKRRTWQAIRTIGGLSITGFSYLLPADVAPVVRAIFGSLSAMSIFDGALGVMQTRSELRAKPYFFSYSIMEKGD